MQVLCGYSIAEVRRMHWQRVLRGVMHGFVSQEASGYFSHYPVNLEESYRLAIQCIIDGLHKAGYELVTVSELMGMDDRIPKDVVNGTVKMPADAALPQM